MDICLRPCPYSFDTGIYVHMEDWRCWLDSQNRQYNHFLTIFVKYSVFKSLGSFYFITTIKAWAFQFLSFEMLLKLLNFLPLCPSLRLTILLRFLEFWSLFLSLFQLMSLRFWAFWSLRFLRSLLGDFGPAWVYCSSLLFDFYARTGSIWSNWCICLPFDVTHFSANSPFQRFEM